MSRKSRAQKPTMADAFKELEVGQSVRIVHRSSGWTAGDIELYGDQIGTIVSILDTKMPDKYRVQLHSGPLAGEHRYFKARELMVGGEW